MSADMFRVGHGFDVHRFSKKFDSNKRSEADEKADELLAELISESVAKQRR